MQIDVLQPGKLVKSINLAKMRSLGDFSQCHPRKRKQPPSSFFSAKENAEIEYEFHGILHVGRYARNLFKYMFLCLPKFEIYFFYDLPPLYIFLTCFRFLDFIQKMPKRTYKSQGGSSSKKYKKRLTSISQIVDISKSNTSVRGVIQSLSGLKESDAGNEYFHFYLHDSNGKIYCFGFCEKQHKKLRVSKFHKEEIL